MKLIDKKNSPIQLISQLKGYFYINPVLSLSLAITIFSFIGIPPLIGFFGKQMVLSAALDQGYYFLVLIAILTSVISAVYYLTLIKEMFFYSSEYKENTFLLSKLPKFNSNNLENTGSHNIIISSPFAFTISIITLIILLFIFVNKE
jgi:NADH-ubiquinone oxidoreductase chain 2